MRTNKEEFMDAKFVELMMRLEELVNRLDKPEQTIEVPDKQDCGEVCYTRLYKADEELMDALCKKTGRKKAQIIRILVSNGLRRGLLNE